MRDAIVIGAGGGGAVIAKELAAQGLDVLVLEAGPAANPDRDWTHFEIDQSAPGSGALRFGPGTGRSRRGIATCHRTASSARWRASVERRSTTSATRPPPIPGSSGTTAEPTRRSTTATTSS